MKIYEFPAYCSFGRGDNGETIVEVALTDKESARLEALAMDEQTYYRGLENCRELCDICSKVYTIAYSQIEDELSDGDFFDDDTDADSYSITVGFPKKFDPDNRES